MTHESPQPEQSNSKVTERAERFDVDYIESLVRRRIKSDGVYGETLLVNPNDWIDREKRADGVHPLLIAVGVETREDVYEALREFEQMYPMYRTAVHEDRSAATITYSIAFR